MVAYLSNDQENSILHFLQRYVSSAYDRRGAGRKGFFKKVTENEVPVLALLKVLLVQ